MLNGEIDHLERARIDVSPEGWAEGEYLASERSDLRPSLRGLEAMLNE